MILKKKPLVFFLFLCFIALSVFLIDNHSRVKALQTNVVPGSLDALAQTILSEGGTSADFELPNFEYPGLTNINDALAEYSVVVAHPVSSTSQILSNEHQIIGTWYKFVVTETLSSKPFPNCDTCQVPPDPPSGLTASTGELLVPRFGGTVSLNGVTITASDSSFPHFQTSQNYLLFVDIDPTRHIGVLSAGPMSAYSVNSNGILSPVTQTPNGLADGLAQTYGNSLPALRSALGFMDRTFS